VLVLRTVHVIGRMPPHGTQRQLAGMLASAHGRLWHATLAVLRAGDALTMEVQAAGVEVEEFSGAYGDPRRLIRLRHVLSTADVVHSSLWGANLAARVVAMSLNPRPAVVVSERSVEDFRSVGHRALDRMLGRWTDEYIANSSDVADFVRRSHRVSRERVTVIGNGIDDRIFFPDLGGHDDEGPRTLGTVGRLIPEKGIDVLIAALPAVLEKRAVTLTVVGDGPERSSLEAAARGLPVSFAGQLSDPADVASFLRSLDVFVMPSRWEGLPNAVLEAQACGVPVVATDVSGMREALRGSSRLVRPERPHELAAAILRALAERPSPAVRFDSFADVAAAHLRVFERAYARHAPLRPLGSSTIGGDR
jgi:glycosyltransferase involved in cell wall biosynthesis